TPLSILAVFPCSLSDFGLIARTPRARRDLPRRIRLARLVGRPRIVARRDALLLLEADRDRRTARGEEQHQDDAENAWARPHPMILTRCPHQITPSGISPERARGGSRALRATRKGGARRGHRRFQ